MLLWTTVRPETVDGLRCSWDTKGIWGLEYQSPVSKEEDLLDEDDYGYLWRS